MTTRNRRFLWIAVLFCLICAFQAKRLRWVGEIGFAIDLIEQAYVEQVDPKTLYRAAMHGMVESLDPYSGYIEAEDYTEFQKVLEQHFGGIGIMVDGPPRLDRITIMTPLYGTPAYEAGLEPGDVLLTIDGKDVQKMEIDEATKLMKGPEGTSVTIEVERKGVAEPIRKSIVRASIEIESVVGDRRRKDARWEYFLEDAPDIAYIRITSFGEKTTQEFRDAIEQVRGKAKGLIIDLRDNPGGLLTAATDICDEFLDDGDIVITKGRHDSFFSRIEAKQGTGLPKEIPVAVIMNDQAASASEVVAGCLQDRKRAIIVGQRSFGKGSVQNLIELDGGEAALKLTTARYYPPSGHNIHRGEDAKETDEWGVMPDPRYTVALDDEQRKKVFQRWRILGSGAGDLYSTESQSGDQGEDSEVLEQGWKDPQLMKAIEAVREQLSK